MDEALAAPRDVAAVKSRTRALGLLARAERLSRVDDQVSDLRSNGDPSRRARHRHDEPHLVALSPPAPGVRARQRPRRRHSKRTSWGSPPRPPRTHRRPGAVEIARRPASYAREASSWTRNAAGRPRASRGAPLDDQRPARARSGSHRQRTEHDLVRFEIRFD